jgi:hypothetical protein
LNAELACSGCHTAGDFATVGDEDFFKHSGLSFFVARGASQQPRRLALL